MSKKPTFRIAGNNSYAAKRLALRARIIFDSLRSRRALFLIAFSSSMLLLLLLSINFEFPDTFLFQLGIFTYVIGTLLNLVVIRQISGSQKLIYLKSYSKLAFCVFLQLLGAWLVFDQRPAMSDYQSTILSGLAILFQRTTSLSLDQVHLQVFFVLLSILIWGSVIPVLVRLISYREMERAQSNYYSSSALRSFNMISASLQTLEVEHDTKMKFSFFQLQNILGALDGLVAGYSSVVGLREVVSSKSLTTLVFQLTAISFMISVIGSLLVSG